MILIPVKDLSRAKQRLAEVLDQPARTELAQAMLTDVLEAVSPLRVPQAPPMLRDLGRRTDQPTVSLVTNDSFAIDLAQRFGCEVIPDPAEKSETDAIEHATRVCEQRGESYTLVLPGDIPLITAAELQQVLRAAPEHGSLLVPSSDKRGTNAALRTPCGLFPLLFGSDSFVPHLASAKATGKPCIVLSLPGISFDIDSPSDLAELCSAPGETRSQQLARLWNSQSPFLPTKLAG